MTPAATPVKLPAVQVQPDRPTCPRAQAGQRCDGRTHWRDGERHGSTRCPLVWLRDFAEEHSKHLAQYVPALSAVGWDRTKPIEQWGAYLLQAVQVERGSPLAQARALAMRAGIARPAGRLLLCGPPGTAKTMLATGLLLSWLAHSGRACAFVPWSRIEALAELSTSQRVSEIERLRSMRVIVLDDVARGLGQYVAQQAEPGSAGAAAVLVEIFDAWQGALIATSNRTLDSLQGHPSVGPVALSRMLAGSADIFTINAPDARAADWRVWGE